MRKAFILCCAAAVLTLAGCSENEISDDVSSIQITETASEAGSSPTPDTSSEAEKRISIKAEVKSYKDGILNFWYKGNEYSLPMTKDRFDNERTLPDRYVPVLSEMIIGNSFGEKITARIALDEDMTRIFKCDVVTPNGKIYDGTDCYDKNNKVIREKLYTMTRKDKSICEISNSEEAFECDLNDLAPGWKLDYPETVSPVMFTTYRFNDGRDILLSLTFNVDVTNGSVGGETDPETLNMYGKRIGFFAAVQSVGEDTVTVLLNDGKTRVTVPTFYCDGELAQGSEVMVLIKSDSTLFGKGGELSFDYGVIITDQDYFKRTTDEFGEIAYGEYLNDWDSFVYTRISDIQRRG